jgi:nucleoside phosphorylase
MSEKPASGIEEVDFIVHIPLEAEYLEFREEFPVVEEIASDYNIIARVKAPGGFSVVAIVQEEMGRSSAQKACEVALAMFRPKAYVCLGIAGGLTKDLNLGDVAYTGNLLDVYDNSKVTDSANGGIDIAFVPEGYATNRKITAGIGFVRTLTSLEGIHNFWREAQAEFAASLLSEPVVGRDGKLETIAEPKCLNGHIVCGAVTESNHYRDRLKGVTRNILAIETESGPIFDACRDRGIEAITIRGISDYADGSKAELEGSTKEAVRKIAARNAAAFLSMQLQNKSFTDAIALVCGNEFGQPKLELEDVARDTIPQWLVKIGDEIDCKLRELSPQYRTKPLGFKLPTPRVKREMGAAARDRTKISPYAEFHDALSRHRRMLLYIPRTYPDHALAWVLASALVTSDVGGKKVVPIVIDGSKLSPPRDDFAKLSLVDLADNIDQQGGEYVFIVDEPPISSKTKVAHLVAELKKYDGSRVVFITRKDQAFVEAAEFSRQVAADSFSVCDVSFSEIAAFIETSFEMPSHQADVVAYKLKGMFNKFDLPAHPSFFAGIPSDALAALLLANRRSELIQLAVDGFLSFVVASDTSEVRLSRTNRSRFLRRLVVEIVLNKRSFSEAQLVSYAKEISDEFDYDLDPIAFIKSFVDAGLIHFEDGHAVLTLPFVEAYLFADEISKDNALAERYFQAVGDDVDLAIFDLYAEIGPSIECVRRVIESLEAAIGALPSIEDGSILLDGRIQPVVFRNPARLASLSKKVTAARIAVSEGASHRDEKARILDITERVNEDVADQALADEGEEDFARSEIHAKILNLLEHWTVATILLGSGAEGINGECRQKLSEAIIRGAEAFMEAILRQINDIDFVKIKDKIIADSNFREFIGSPDDKEFSDIVSSIVDFVEFVSLSDQVDRIFDRLPDRASHRIVSNSVQKAEVIGKVQELIKLSWITNITPDKSKQDFIRAIHDLPHTQFFRATLTSILMMRVKWKVSDFDTRMALLDAAEEAVRPFNTTLDKGEMIRFVQQHVPSKDNEEENVDTPEN